MKGKQPRLTWLTIKKILKESQWTVTEGYMGTFSILISVGLSLLLALGKTVLKKWNLILIIVIGILLFSILLWIYARIRYTLQLSRILSITLCPNTYQIQSVGAYIDKIEQLRNCDKLIMKFTGDSYFSIGGLYGEIDETLIQLSQYETTTKGVYDSLRSGGLFDQFNYLNWYK